MSSTFDRTRGPVPDTLFSRMQRRTHMVGVEFGSLDRETKVLLDRALARAGEDRDPAPG